MATVYLCTSNWWFKKFSTYDGTGSSFNSLQQAVCSLDYVALWELQAQQWYGSTSSSNNCSSRCSQVLLQVRSNAGASRQLLVRAILATQGLGYLGTALLLGGAAMMLAPDVPDGNFIRKSRKLLIRRTSQYSQTRPEPIPLVYGRAIVGSKTISASLFTNTSRQKLTAGRKMVGIPNFRTDGSKSGKHNTTSSANSWAINIGHIINEERINT